MDGFASPGDGVGTAEAAGEEPSMGANLADEAEASLLRAESLLRDDMVRWQAGACGLAGVWRVQEEVGRNRQSTRGGGRDSSA